MSELGSIIEYSTSIADAEAPLPLPVGDYPVEISGAEHTESKSSGKPNVKVSLRVNPNDYPADYEDAEAFPEGKTVTYYVPAGGDRNSMFRMRRFCEAIGAPMGKTIDVNDWIGRTAVASIEHDSFEGIDRERVKGIQKK